jgi:hypothetical protein
MTEEPKIAKGFDRDIDFKPMKLKLINEIDKLYAKLGQAETPGEKRIATNQLCYVMIACIQLRNGSRISEACNCFLKYMNGADLDEKQIIKIAKSEGMKWNGSGIKKMSKARYRKMMFPSDWIDISIFEEIKDAKPLILFIRSDRLRQRVRDYLLKYLDCNTHSLRYACINYLLYTEKRPMADVAKFVGHTSVGQMVLYTQAKNTEQIFDLDI